MGAVAGRVILVSAAKHNKKAAIAITFGNQRILALRQSGFVSAMQPAKQFQIVLCARCI
jgi:hypothetical protein